MCTPRIYIKKRKKTFETTAKTKQTAPLGDYRYAAGRPYYALM